MNSATPTLPAIALGLATAIALPAAATAQQLWSVEEVAAPRGAEISEGRAVVGSPISRGEYTDCRPTTAPLVFDGGYQVSMCYETAEGTVGEARAGIWASGQSGLLWFFNRDNAEVLVKVLDGCSYDGRRWVLVAPVTDVAFNLHVTSTGDRQWTYRNRLGATAAARSDTSAFVCADDDATSTPVAAGTRPEIATGQAVVGSPISRGQYTDCRPTTTPLVFDGGYHVSMCYETAEGTVGEARGGDRASDVLCSTFGNEGTGVKCELNYPWAVGSTYRFEVTEEEMDGGSAMTLTVADLAAGSKRFVGTIRFARRAAMTSFAMFVEDFRRRAPHCLARQVRSAAIRRPRALINGAWVALDEMTRGYLAARQPEDPFNPGTPDCANSAAREHAAGLELVIGGETASDPNNASPYYTIPRN